MRGLLNAPLAASRRKEHLEEMCGQFIYPLHVTVASLRSALNDPVSMEDYRRLHILISHLYHQRGASIPLITQLRAEVNSVFARRG